MSLALNLGRAARAASSPAAEAVIGSPRVLGSRTPGTPAMSPVPVLPFFQSYSNERTAHSSTPNASPGSSPSPSPQRGLSQHQFFSQSPAPSPARNSIQQLLELAASTNGQSPQMPQLPTHMLLGSSRLESGPAEFALTGGGPAAAFSAQGFSGSRSSFGLGVPALPMVDILGRDLGASASEPSPASMPSAGEPAAMGRGLGRPGSMLLGRPRGGIAQRPVQEASSTVGELSNIEIARRAREAFLAQRGRRATRDCGADCDVP